MRKKNYLHILVIASCLSGCASTSNYQAVLNHWQGARAQDLVSCWGRPDGAIKTACGNSVYMYKRQRFYTTMPATPAPNFVSINGTPMYTTAFTGGFGGQTISRFCNTWFEVNPQGIIVSSQFQGNNCIANNPNSLTP